jgi:hypothetical protein
MKSILLSLLALGLMSTSCKKETIQAPPAKPVIENGTYAIVNVGSQKALAPVQLIEGQNVFCDTQVANDLKQRWNITFDGTYYTIQCNQSSNHYFQPFPGGDHTAIISFNDGNSNPKFIIEKLTEDNADYFVIKSVLLGQHALYEYPVPFYTEARFQPFQNLPSFKWQFVKY